jgi:hypothetical protein
MKYPQPDIEKMLDHIRYLAGRSGGRGSCTSGESQAAIYLAEQMRALGLKDVRLESFQGSHSTYHPYALAFLGALIGTLLVLFSPGRIELASSALLNLLGLWGMLAETDFTSNWTRWLLPSAPSQNAIGILPARRATKQRVILCAHLDTHRTPIFYSSRSWHKLFSTLVSLAFLSMLAAGFAFLAGSIFNWGWVIWLGIPAAGIQIFALALCLHADLTPFSPGANDNASGVAVCLALARQLKKTMLDHTDVWLAFTGCEETAAYGMAAFLNAHADHLGKEAYYIILDQVGCGYLEYLTRDGLVIKRPTHPQALKLASHVAASLPEIRIKQTVGIAYTDALVATKKGLKAITIVAVPPPGSTESTHWHQMSDTPEHIEGRSLAEAFSFAWGCLTSIENEAKETT